MNKRDRIVEILEGVYHEGCHDQDAKCYAGEEYFNQVADEIMALDDWIPVSERLPDEGKLVLWYRRGEIVLDYAEDPEDAVCSCNWTHWKPIKGPKE